MLKATFKGDQILISGPLLNVGSKAPNFELVDQDLNPVSLNSLGNQKKLLNVYVSLDTSVCALSVHSFEKKGSSIPHLTVLNISMDLPFAAARFCKNEGLDNAITLSAFRSSFPDDYGVRIVDSPLKGLCARAVFVLNGENTVLYRELVPEITHEPNYEAALRTLSGK